MKLLFLFALALGLGAATMSVSADELSLFELRIYTAAPGKLNDLHARFRDHTTKLFAKHGMTNVGYWVPIDNKENKLVYLLGYLNQEAKARSWKAFGADPDWTKAAKASEANGRLVTGVSSTLLTPTNFSPVVKPTATDDRVFELRTYIATAGKLDNLNARFRDHTLKLFEKHGMTNVGYWTPVKGQRGKNNDDTLIYLLAHKSEAAAKASWDAFRADQVWIDAKKASEDRAGGSLTVQDGVKSEFLKPTDYSPMK